MKKYLFFAAVGVLFNLSQVQASESLTVQGWRASYAVGALKRAHVSVNHEAGNDVYSVKDLSCESAWTNAYGPYASCTMTDSVTGLSLSDRMSQAQWLFDLLKGAGISPTGTRNDLWIKDVSLVCYGVRSWLHSHGSDFCVVTRD